jgi:hypothetical protein
MDEPLESAVKPEGNGKKTAEETRRAERAVEAESVDARQALIASVDTRDLGADASIIGTLTASGDVEIATSVVGLVSAQHDVSLSQGYSSVMIAGGDSTVTQGGAGVLVGRTLAVEAGGGGVLVAGDARVSNGWVGVLLARDAELSEDSRVFIDTRAAAIIGGIVVVGAAIVAVASLGVFGTIANRFRR